MTMIVVASADPDTEEEAEITIPAATAEGVLPGALGNASTFGTRGIAVTETNVVSRTGTATDPDPAFRPHQDGIMGDVSDAHLEVLVMVTTIAVLLAVMQDEITTVITLDPDFLAGVEEEFATPFATTAIADMEMTANFLTNDYASLLYSSFFY